MARKKAERHGGDGARKEADTFAEEAEERRGRRRANGATEGPEGEEAPEGGDESGDVRAAAAAMPPALPAPESSNEAVRRAEELVDDLGDRIGQYAYAAGQQLRRLAARAREEAEDIWAEAQSIRQGAGGQTSGGEPAAAAPSGPALERADQLVDDVGDRVGRFASRLGQGLRRLALQAREEAKGIWAEAQNLRRGQKP